MADNILSTPYIPFNLPWFMWDLRNQQLIVSDKIPGDISDTKKIVVTETPIPGLNFDKVQSGGMGNRKVSFTLPILNKNNTIGNIIMLKQFEALRNTPVSMRDLFSTDVQFGGGNKVIYMWGTGNSVPLEYFVTKCEFVHNANFVNRFGNPQLSFVSIELLLDEESSLYRAEEMFRRLNTFVSGTQDSYNIVKRLIP